jgi:adenylate cyclase class 2
MSSELRQNLELKARYANLATARERLRPLDVRAGGIEMQTDTYFLVAHGRLKLREIEGQPAILIWYERPDRQASRPSRYYLVPVTDVPGMKAALTAALGVRGTVRKRREIYHFRNVRIHLDAVVNLGTCVEFEAALSPEDNEATAQQLLDQLCAVLSIQPMDLLAPSYAELLGTFGDEHAESSEEGLSDK